MINSKDFAKKYKEANNAKKKVEHAGVAVGVAGVLLLGYAIGTTNSTKVVKFPYPDGTIL